MMSHDELVARVRTWMWKEQKKEWQELRQVSWTRISLMTVLWWVTINYWLELGDVLYVEQKTDKQLIFSTAHAVLFESAMCTLDSSSWQASCALMYVVCGTKETWGAELFPRQSLQCWTVPSLLKELFLHRHRVD